MTKIIIIIVSSIYTLIFTSKLNRYRGDLTQWREDMNFILERQNNILRKSAASEYNIVFGFSLYRHERFTGKHTEIKSSLNSRVRLRKINHSGPGCNFCEF